MVTLSTQKLMTVIAEPGRRAVPGYSTGPTTTTALLEDSLHGSPALDLFEFPLHQVTGQTQPDLVITHLSPGISPPYTVTGVTGIPHFSEELLSVQGTAANVLKQHRTTVTLFVYFVFK